MRVLYLFSHFASTFTTNQGPQKARRGSFSKCHISIVEINLKTIQSNSLVLFYKEIESLTRLYSHDLPPTIVARPLPVAQSSKDRVTNTGSRSAKVQRGKRDGKDGFIGDDTPKAFARLMRFQAVGRFPCGLDDGSKDRKHSKKRKRETDEDAAPAKGSVARGADTKEIPKILPGEKMSDFAARVNAALPVSGLAVKGRKKNGLDIGERQTRLERKMQKMQAEWRKEEQRRREKREEEVDERDDDIWFDDMPAMDESISRKKKKGRRNKAGLDEDPWERIKIARNEAPRTLHDVVQAPPKLLNRPRRAFGVANGARVDVSEIPKSAGSLRKREELGLARKNVLENYRRMMEGRRGVGEVVTTN